MQSPHANTDLPLLPAPEQFQCFEICNPPETENESIHIALAENAQNALGSTGVLPEKTEVPPKGTDEGLSYFAVNISKKWQPGRMLKIKFLSGKPEQHAKVQKYAEWWQAYANLKFQW